jgi:hypothetical protein
MKDQRSPEKSIFYRKLVKADGHIEVTLGAPFGRALVAFFTLIAIVVLTLCGVNIGPVLPSLLKVFGSGLP